MDFKELETFITIVEKGSISAAAAALGVTQPAVSKRMSRLEEELGATLFVPGHRHCALTPEGESFQRGALKLLETRRKIRNEIAQQTQEMAGTVVISASTIPGEYLLPPLLADFHSAYPAVSLAVKIHDSQDALAELADRRADMALIGADKSLPGHRTKPLFEDELVVVLPRWHSLAERPFITMEDLEGLEMVGRLPGSGTRSLWEREYRNATGTAKDTGLCFATATGLINAVAVGAGCGVVSRLAAECAKDRVAIVPLRPAVTRRFYLVRSQCESRPVAALAEFLTERASRGKA